MTAPGERQDAAPAVGLSVIIVNWNVRELLARCLASILDGVDPGPVPRTWRLPSGRTFEILVIEVKSNDNLPIREFFAEYQASHVPHHGGNIGFCQRRSRLDIALCPIAQRI